MKILLEDFRNKGFDSLKQIAEFCKDNEISIELKLVFIFFLFLFSFDFILCFAALIILYIINLITQNYLIRITVIKPNKCDFNVRCSGRSSS